MSITHQPQATEIDNRAKMLLGFIRPRVRADAPKEAGDGDIDTVTLSRAMLALNGATCERHLGAEPAFDPTTAFGIVLSVLFKESGFDLAEAEERIIKRLREAWDVDLGEIVN